MTHFSSALLVAALCTGSVAAQDSPPPPQPAGPAVTVDPGNRTGRFPQRTLENRMLADLTPEQRAQLEKANETFRRTVDPQEQKLQELRAELEEAISAETIDENAIRAKAQAMASVEGDIAVARALRIAKLREFLSAEQVKRFNAPTPQYDRRTFGRFPRITTVPGNIPPPAPSPNQAEQPAPPK